MNNKIIKTLIFITFIFILILINNNKTYAAMSNATVTLSKYSYTYTGKSKKPKVTVKFNGKTLRKGVDYKVRYKDNVNAGKGKVIVTGLRKGLGGQIVKKFTIKKRNISSYKLSIDDSSCIYNGKTQKPSVIISNLNSKNYTVSCRNCISAGTGEVIIKGKNNCDGKIERKFTIHKRDIEDFSFSKIKSYTYTGKKIKPTVSISSYYSGIEPKLNIDYTVSYKNNINAGTGKVIIKAKNKNNKGKKELTFKIEPLNITNRITIKVESGKYKNTGKPIKFKIKAVYCSINGKDIALNNKDYTILKYLCHKHHEHIFNNNYFNMYEIRIKGKGNFTGSIDKFITSARIDRPTFSI